MISTLGSFIEWYGTIAILGAFGLSMFGVIPFQGTMFYILNLSGAIALVIGGGFKQSWHSTVFYFLWGVITALVYFNII